MENQVKECTKIKFHSEAEARNELFRIVEGTIFKPWKDKKPSRKYLCRFCSTKGKEVWHLTSSTKIKNYEYNR